MTTSLTLTAALKDYNVPSVDYTQLMDETATTISLLQALQHDGIVALKNIPNYSTLRNKYLEKAASCAVVGRENGAEFLLHRRLKDGTQRYTISTESGRRLADSGQETLNHCPGYLEVYQEFSNLVETAVATVGQALDSSQAFQVYAGTNGDTITARELMEESVHLDHFHAYEAVGYNRRQLMSNDDDLSLEMHTDNGVMIAMSAPDYFDVLPSGAVRSKQTRSEDAGLIIQTAEGETVRPLLQADELVLMVGSGIDQWITTRPQLHPVLHGMRYPRGISYADEDEETHKILRAWFGKMVLLQSDQVMANTGMTYGEYANQTTRYLLESKKDYGFAAVACPPQTRLLASDTACQTKICTAKSGVDESSMTYSCQITCNHDSTDDAALCTKNCDCEDDTVAGHNCWMLCVSDLSTDVCPGTQECNNAFTMQTLAMECTTGTVAPSTTTTTSTSSANSNTGSSPSTTTSAPTPTTTAPTTTSSASSSSDETTEETTSSSSSSAGTVAPTTSSASGTSSSASLDAGDDDVTSVDSGSASTSSSSAAVSMATGSIYVMVLVAVTMLAVVA